ncbi:MAG: hypothetical protein JW780_06330 [Clostridiales bacterium]|nr:hypothetical protein [Clostridiales bacterium]
MNRRIVKYGLISGGCLIYAGILYAIDSFPEHNGIMLRVVYLTSASLSLAALVLTVFAVVVRYKRFRKGALPRSEPSVFYRQEDENATILRKKDGAK